MKINLVSQIQSAVVMIIFSAQAFDFADMCHVFGFQITCGFGLNIEKA